MALLLDLREVRAEERIDCTYPAQAFSLDTDRDDEGRPGREARDEYVVADGVSLSLLVRKDGETYRVVGRVKSALRLNCSRCLEPFEVQSELTVDLLYLPHGANRGETEAEITEDDLSTAFYRDEQIDLAQMVHEQFQLALPMKPLCRDDCQGLCPACGANLNEHRCSCETRWHDPRLAALERLLTDRRRESEHER